MAKKVEKVAVKQEETKVSVNAVYDGIEIPSRFDDLEHTFVVAGVCRMESFKDKDYVKQSCVTVRLLDPFDDEDFTSIEITPKWANSGGLFKYHAKKKLREESELRFPVFITPITFYSKKAEQELTIPGIFVPSLYSDGYVEFQIRPGFKGAPSEELAVFRSLVAKRWNFELDELPEAPAEDGAYD